MRPSKSIAGILLGLVFLIIAIIAFHNWRADLINYDNIHDLENASLMVHSHQLPHHGGLASFGVFNPPGIAFGLVPGLLLFPHEPDLAIRTATVLLSGLTILGLFILIRKRFSLSVAFWACLIYLLSSTGWYYMTSLRPRAHPVFLVWVLYFTDLWIIDKKQWAIFPLALVLSAGLYWMLEIAPLALAVVLIGVVFRPVINWKWALGGIALGAAIWIPYLNFQQERDFHDLKFLLFKQERAHDFWQLYLTELAEAGLQSTLSQRVHAIPGYTPAQPQAKPAVNADPEHAVQQKRFLDPYREPFPNFLQDWQMPVLLVLTLLACLVPLFGKSRIRWKEILSRNLSPDKGGYLIWVTAFLACWPVLYVLTKHTTPDVVEKRFFWLWALHGPLIALGLSMLLDKLVPQSRVRGIIYGACMLFLGIGMLMNPIARQYFNSWKSCGLRTAPEIEIHKVINDAAWLIKEYNIPPKIGYDRPFLAWVAAVHQIDGVSSVSRQADVMFKFRHGITNLNQPPFCVGPDDSIRIVEHFSRQPWRQTYLNLSEFPEMEIWRQYKDHTILIRPDLVPRF